MQNYRYLLLFCHIFSQKALLRIRSDPDLIGHIRTFLVGSGSVPVPMIRLGLVPDPDPNLHIAQLLRKTNLKYIPVQVHITGTGNLS
jgi:hypothetical protein